MKGCSAINDLDLAVFESFKAISFINIRGCSFLENQNLKKTQQNDDVFNSFLFLNLLPLYANGKRRPEKKPSHCANSALKELKFAWPL